MDTTFYKNTLSQDEYEKIYFKKIYPILIGYGFEYDVLPKTGIDRHCSNSNCFSCKFMGNGDKTICDGINNCNTNNCISLWPIQDKCINCYDFCYCGGQKPCDKLCNGKYPYKENALNRVKYYIESILQNDVTS
jgi:hypothetical protein